MADNVVIGFESDVTALNQVIDLLEKLGQVDKKTADEFRAANKTYSDRKKLNDDAAKSADDLGKKTESAGKKIKAAGKDAKEGLGGISDILGNIASGVAAAFAVERIIAFANESIKAFTDSEAKTNKLKFALENITKDGGAFSELVKQSEELQDKLKIFDSEDIQSIQAAQAQFGLTAEQIKKLTPLILELSVAQGVDLASATDIALNAIKGQTKGLRDVGADFKNTGSEIGNFNQLTQNLAKFQGTAADALNTTTGKLQAQNVALGNIQEEIGAKLAPAFVKLKTVILEAVAGLVGLRAEVDRPTNTSIFESLLKDVSDEQLTKRLATINKQVEDYTKKADDLRKKNEAKGAGNVSQVDALALKEANKQLDLAIEKQTAINNVLNSRKAVQDDIARSAELEKLQKQDLLSLSKAQLTSDIATLKLRKDANTSAIKDEIERREEAIVALEKLEADAAKKSAAARQSASEKLAEQTKKDQQDALTTNGQSAVDKLKQEQKNAEENAKILFEAGQKTKKDKENLNNDLLAIDAIYRDKILKAEQDQAEKLRAQNEKNLQQDLKDTLAVQDMIAAELSLQAINNFQAKGDFSTKAQQELSDELARIEVDAAITKDKEILNSSVATDEEKLAAKKDITDQQIKLANDAAKKEIELAKTKADIIREIENAALEGLLELYSANIDSQISLLEKQQEEGDRVADEKEQKNQDRRDKGIIGEREFRANEKKLLQEKTAAEEASQKKINDLKRKADIANRAQKLFEIGLATFRNATEQPGPLGVLIPFWIALGATQAALLLATPLPKYHSGRLAKGTGKEEHAVILDNETVVNPQKSRDYYPTLKAIHNGTIKAKTLNDFATGKWMKMNLLQNSTNQFKDFDYDKFAVAYARANADVIRGNRNGFTAVVRAIEKQGSQVEANYASRR